MPGNQWNSAYELCLKHDFNYKLNASFVNDSQETYLAQVPRTKVFTCPIVTRPQSYCRRWIQVITVTSGVRRSLQGKPRWLV